MGTLARLATRGLVLVFLFLWKGRVLSSAYFMLSDLPPCSVWVDWPRRDLSRVGWIPWALFLLFLFHTTVRDGPSFVNRVVYLLFLSLGCTPPRAVCILPPSPFKQQMFTRGRRASASLICKIIGRNFKVSEGEANFPR